MMKSVSRSVSLYIHIRMQTIAQGSVRIAALMFGTTTCSAAGNPTTWISGLVFYFVKTLNQGRNSFSDFSLVFVKSRVFYLE